MELAARLPARGRRAALLGRLGKGEREAVRGCERKERHSRVAVEVDQVSIGKRQRRQLLLTLTEAVQFVQRPDTRARVTHHFTDVVANGGYVQAIDDEVFDDAWVICAAIQARLGLGLG